MPSALTPACDARAKRVPVVATLREIARRLDLADDDVLPDAVALREIAQALLESASSVEQIALDCREEAESADERLESGSYDSADLDGAQRQLEGAAELLLGAGTDDEHENTVGEVR